jgi:aminoglycoside phosphotransferase family enzyme/predicted kinase
MIVEDQSATEAFLGGQARSGSAQPGESSPVVATHISKVFLSDHFAFKLKRAVRFPYLDFSTATARLAACERELALNRRTAPGLYRAVRRIVRTAEGALAFDADGTLVDAAVEMRRFDQADLFDALALRGALAGSTIADLAHRIASFHGEAEISTRHGGVAGMEAVLDINDRSLRATGLAPAREADELAARFRAALSRHRPVLEARRLAGKVRRCHGDLILRNICLFEGVPTLFDCLEFDEDLATIDVLYDLAFLIMDLLHRGLADQANLLFNRYLDEADERDGLSLVSFFVAVRAAVRAHVTGARAAEAPSGEAAAVTKEARAYLDLASSLLADPRPRLIAIGGLSGAGKSTVAAAVAPMSGLPPGARILSTDRIRKSLHGVRPEQHLPLDAYRPEMSAKVYATMREMAQEALGAGCAVVADAVFDRPSERDAIEEVARDAGVPFGGVWLDAPIDAMMNRVKARAGDPSDATAEVLLGQISRDLGAIAWRRVDAARGVADIVAEALRMVAGEGQTKN